jgi:hypothetical protein
MAATPPWRARDRAALAAGPWCWPPDAALEFEAPPGGPAVPPVPRPGHVAAVTVRGQTTTLWHLYLAPRGEARGTALGADARASWRNAGIALPRSLPVLWRSVHDATRDEPVIERLGVTIDAPAFEERDAVVDGPSFGLAFFLLLASSVLDCPVPGDVIASAAIDAYGRLHGVDGLRQKLEGVRALAPGVSRVVVCADQAREAGRHTGGTIEVIGASSAAEALERVYGPQLSTLLVHAGSDPARRAELTSSFFRLALVGRGAAIDWSPVARGADQALRAWTDLGPDERYQLQFARAVAARHESNEGELPLPEPAWLQRRPRTIRVQVLSHLVQQCADTGRPEARVVEALATPEIADDLNEAFVPQLRLHGALCRLWALTGRAERALADNERLTRAALAGLSPGEASFPLSEWLRLSAALGDAPSFERASAAREEAQTLGGFGDHGTPYVDLAWARGRLGLSPGDASALAIVRRLSHDPSVPAHVRWSAQRWARGHGSGLPSPGEADASALARRYQVLAALDGAVAAGDAAAAASLVDELERLDPGPVGHLRRHGAGPADVARLYPY